MPLQRPFKGLSDHIGLFLGGNVPMELLPQLVLNSSAEDFVNIPEYRRTPNVTLTAINQIAQSDTVPGGEMWRVRYFGFNGVPSSGTPQMKPVINDGVTTFGLGMDWPDASASGVNAFYGIQFPGQEGLLLMPGMWLGWEWFKGGGGNISGCETLILRQRILI